MKDLQIKMFLWLMVLGLIFQGCAKDDAELLGSEAILISENNENRGGNGGGGNGGNGGGNNPRNVASLDNDVVLEWTNLLLELDRYSTGMRPTSTSRALAYIYLASYETALPGMRNFISNTEHLDGFELDEDEMPNRVDFELALNACFADVMDHFILNISSDLKAKIDALEETLDTELSERLPNRLIEDSKEWGAYVATQVIAYSQTDQAAEAQIYDPQPLSYEPPTGDGYWTYSADPERALFPYWGTVRTFVISPDETTTVAPMEYSENPNSPYYQQMEEVYTVNNTAKEEQNEQLWIAEFWSDDVEGIMFSPPARQYAISNQLIEQYSLNLEETLNLYLKLGFSLNDAAVATWKYKYEYMVMRPNVFIHELIDPDFQTNLYRLIYWPNPSFPGYPSGHSSFASAAGGVFIDFFGNNTNFVDRSHEGREEFQSTPRRFNSFRDMAEENAFSRIPLGVHIRMDCTEGLRLGYEISDAINDLDLKRGEPL